MIQHVTSTGNMASRNIKSRVIALHENEVELPTGESDSGRPTDQHQRLGSSVEQAEAIVTEQLKTTAGPGSEILQSVSSKGKPEIIKELTGTKHSEPRNLFARLLAALQEGNAKFKENSEADIIKKLEAERKEINQKFWGKLNSETKILTRFCK
jgi:hypothetical protein